MTTEAAAERPQLLPEPNIEIVDDTGEVWRWCKTEETSQHLCKVLTEYDREHDTDLVDEAFAQSVGRSDGGAMHSKHFSQTYRVSKTISLLNVIEPGSDEWELHIGDEFIHNPTIGDFYTACRLFRVDVKEKA